PAAPGRSSSIDLPAPLRPVPEGLSTYDGEWEPARSLPGLPEPLPAPPVALAALMPADLPAPRPGERGGARADDPDVAFYPPRYFPEPPAAPTSERSGRPESPPDLPAPARPSWGETDVYDGDYQQLHYLPAGPQLSGSADVEHATEPLTSLPALLPPPHTLSAPGPFDLPAIQGAFPSPPDHVPAPPSP